MILMETEITTPRNALECVELDTLAVFDWIFSGALTLSSALYNEYGIFNVLNMASYGLFKTDECNKNLPELMMRSSLQLLSTEADIGKM